MGQNIQTLKGFRDFLPTEARRRTYVIDTLKKVFESYGFEPLETPVLEYEEILMGKYGDEGDKLMYKFTDNGDRRVAMRYDQTVPLARVVAQYGEILPSPFKRYQVSNVFRGENTQKGRFREFLQCDIDITGVNSAQADSEILKVAIASMERLGFKNFKILINDRATFKDIPKEAIIIIDKLKKIGEDGVKLELKSKEIDETILDTVRNSKETPRISDVLQEVNDPRVIFEPTLARGLDYYTGIIIEVEIEGYDAGSVGGGGRYDNLIGMFSGSSVPAVGFAFGFDRLMEALDSQNLLKINPSVTKVLVTVFDELLLPDSLQIANELRNNKINTELYLDPTAKMEKQLKYAIKKQIPYMVVLGPEEKEKGVVTIKALDTREQKTVALGDAIQMLA
ncbi:MAG: histidine--tRNA ligase [Candidatus Levybacteria bacterium]|nr:histidine--tRNA ligase [Candidatus Levybacteria bacterium]